MLAMTLCCGIDRKLASFHRILRLATDHANEAMNSINEPDLPRGEIVDRSYHLHLARPHVLSDQWLRDPQPVGVQPHILDSRVRHQIAVPMRPSDLQRRPDRLDEFGQMPRQHSVFPNRLDRRGDRTAACMSKHHDQWYAQE